MRSLFFATAFLFLANLISVSFCAPLRMGQIYNQNDLSNAIPVPHNTGNDAKNLKVIETAIAGANEQIVNMKAMLDRDPKDPELLKHVTNAFGPNPNMARIKDLVDKLAKAPIDIGTIRAPNTETLATVSALSIAVKNTARILFTEKFYQMTPIAQVGILLHEAAHSVGATVDYFGTVDPETGHPLQKGQLSTLSLKEGNNPKHQALSGYLHEDFEKLKEGASDQMHKNTDSYRLLGHTATHGLGSAPPDINHMLQPQHQPGAKKDGCTVC